MNRITPLADLRPGMVLGDAASVDGQVLLARGTALTQAHLGVLAARGVRSLAIAVPEANRTTVDTRLVLALDRSLRPRFARTDLQHVAMKEIYRLALMRRIHQVSQAAAAPGDGHAG
jgi:hypothetical protein